MGNERKNRQSYRLRGHDYSQVGEYFVTLCTKDREHLFGEITNGVVQLTKAGEIAMLAGGRFRCILQTLSWTSLS